MEFGKRDEFGDKNKVKTTYRDMLYVYISIRPSPYSLLLPSFKKVIVTTGLALFAECRIHSAKALLHSAKGLPSVALGKPHSVKKSDGECTFAECLFSGTRQSLCRVSKSTRQTFRNQIRKTAFKNSKTFYFHPVITPIIQCHKSQVSLLFRVKSCATRLP